MKTENLHDLHIRRIGDLGRRNDKTAIGIEVDVEMPIGVPDEMSALGARKLLFVVFFRKDAYGKIIIGAYQVVFGVLRHFRAEFFVEFRTQHHEIGEIGKKSKRR